MSDHPPGNLPPALAPKPDRTWDTLCHLAALAGYVAPVVGNIIGPLIVWLVKKDELPSVNEHGKESLNFQISFTLWALLFFTVAGGVTLILTFFFIGFLLIPVLVVLACAVSLANLILVIIATVKASNGEFYRYPFSIRFIT